jgi:hypothetical protein
MDINEIDHNLPYYIEIGASRTTTLILINNGIPRTVAIYIARMLPSDIKDFNECEIFIRKNQENIKQSISSILFDEIIN